MCFDLTDIKLFESIDFWLNEINKENLSNPIVILVGTKSDLVKSRVITKKQALKKATELKLQGYFESSFKTNEGIDEIL